MITAHHLVGGYHFLDLRESGGSVSNMPGKYLAGKVSVKHKRTASIARWSLATILVTAISVFAYRAWSRSSGADQLVEAVRTCDISTLKSLLKAGVPPGIPAVNWVGLSVGEPHRVKYYAMSVAASEGCVEALELLEAHGASLGAEDSEGMTALDLAARKGQPASVEWLLQHGANVGHRDDAGRTALHWAAGYGDPASVQLLLSHGANPDLSDSYRLSPRGLARKRSDKNGKHIVQIFSVQP